MKEITIESLVKTIRGIRSMNLYYIEKRLYKLTQEFNLNTQMKMYIADFLDIQEDILDQKVKYRKLKRYISEIEY